MTAVYGSYPQRYKAMDGFRMGNFLLLGGAGINVAKEFIWGGPRTLMEKTPLRGFSAAAMTIPKKTAERRAEAPIAMHILVR